MSLLDRAARFIDDVLLLPEDVRERLEEAERALAANSPAHAEALLRQIIAERPSLVRARQGLALALEARGDIAGGRAVLAVARQLDPDEPELALLSARLALAAGDVEAAVEESRDAARRLAAEGGAPFAQACVMRARAERRRQRPDRAVRELRKALAASDEIGARVELVEALVESGRPEQAAGVARAIEPGALDDATAGRLGLALFRSGEGERGRLLLERYATTGSAEAARALAVLDLINGELVRAEASARTAVARGGGADALVTLADVLAAAGRHGEAAQALSAAAAMRGEDIELLRRAARMVPLGAAAELSELADRIEARAPGDEIGRALRAFAALANQRIEIAEAVLTPAPLREPRLALAAVALALHRAQPQRALALLDGELHFEPHDLARVDELRRGALRALWRGPGGEVDLAAAIDQVARFAQGQRLDELARRTLSLRDELDRPLLLAILGEFNAGKSTLVNAFVGADVAPTGILPTTATLNVLRGGAERRVRVVRRDGTTREGEYDQLKGLLREAQDQIAIDHIEIVLPSELLERVWILDTPGSNAPITEHEELAREAMRRADAALWIFDAGQAGKATEGRVLEAVRASRRHVVAAINKIDRLGEGQLEQVRAALARELPEVAALAVPLSAKRALKARLAGDDAEWQKSGFPDLLARLEQDVFSRTRPLKRRACGGRLLALLGEALATETSAVSAFDARLAALESAKPLSAGSSVIVEALDEVLALLTEEQDRAFHSAAEEVLAFVRPRTNRFATHGADAEDRAFLAEVIEARLVAASAATEVRLVARLFGLLADHATQIGVGPHDLDRRVRAAMGVALARFAGLQSGMLLGGGLRRFFDEVLPHAELKVEPLAEALTAARAHPTDHLRASLQDAVAELLADLEAERAQARARTDRERQGLRDRTYEPLRALRGVLEELVD